MKKHIFIALFGVTMLGQAAVAMQQNQMLQKLQLAMDLSAAVQAGETNTVKNILDSVKQDSSINLQAFINTRLHNRTPLCWAIIKQNLDMVKLLLSYGASPITPANEYNSSATTIAKNAGFKMNRTMWEIYKLFTGEEHPKKLWQQEQRAQFMNSFQPPSEPRKKIRNRTQEPKIEFEDICKKLF